MASPSTPATVTAPPAITVLGRVTVRGPDGAPAEPPGARSRALVVALALAGRAGASVTQLVDDLWEEDPPRDARAALQALVSRLRRLAAAGTVVSTAAGYALGPEATTDLAEAERLSERLAHPPADDAPTDAAEAAARALALWGGPVGADLPPGALADDLRMRSARLREALRRGRAARLLHAGRTTEALVELDALVAEHPLDEALAGERMRALAAEGRTAEALAVFAELRRRLRDELGGDPGPELVRLNARLLQRPAATDGDDGTGADPDGAAPAPGAAGTAATETARPAQRRIGLRRAPNALLGRAADLAAIADLLTEHRAVTILGVGGLGKTRLAFESARLLADAGDEPDVVVVELAGVRSGDDVAQAIAFTLGIREVQAGRVVLSDPAVRHDVREHILNALARRPTILVLDNCEHVIDAAAAWAADLLGALAELRILATSRTPLAIAGERVYPLAPLAGGAEPSAEHGPAVELFLERARAARPGAALPVDVVARLCERLDGLPLAIELAAARIRSMPVDEIERRLENRFALLTAGDRAAPVRHRTLFAVIDWSWNLLDARERTLLRRLSRFPDGFGAEAAQAVGSADGADVADALDGLVMQSLVTASESPATGAMRYRMLETVREFGERELAAAGDAEAADAGMNAWAVGFGGRMLAELDTSGPIGYRVVGEELDNLIAVLRRATAAGDGGTAVTVFALLGIFWMIRGNRSDLAGFAPVVGEMIRGYEPDEGFRDATMLTLVFVSTMLAMGMPRLGMTALARLRRMQRRAPAADADVDMLVRLMLAMIEGPEAVTALLDGASRSAAPRVAAIADLIGAQLEENDGEVGRALERAARCRERGLEAGSNWLPANAAQVLAELHSQSGDVDAAITWAHRARAEFLAMQDGHDALHAGITAQLDWLEALNRLGLGDIETAEDLVGRYSALEADEAGFDDEDRRSLAAACRAEIALARGDVDAGLHRYRDAVAGLGWGVERGGPWTLSIAAGCLAAHILTGANVAELRDLARTLRVRMLVTHRLRGAQNDLPVTGCGARALGALLAVAAADEDARAAGLRLLALSGRIAARQDLPSLHTAPLVAAAAAACGDSAVEAALDAAARRPVREAYDEVVALLSSRAVRAALTPATGRG